MDCHGLPAAVCSEIVLAALRELPDTLPDVTAAAAWRSLLCHDNFDCALMRLTGHRPLGSAALMLGPGGPTAWFDVLEAERDPGSAWLSRPTEAWMVRWNAGG